MTIPTDSVLDLPDLLTPSAFDNGIPHDRFDAIRARPGLHWQPHIPNTEFGGLWVLTRTQDILEVDGDGERFSSKQGVQHPLMMLPEDNFLSDIMIQMDGERHSRIRRVVARAFAPRIVSQFETWIREYVTEALDNLVASRGTVVDYVPVVAAPIPCRVVARILGVPKQDEPFIIRITNTLFAIGGSGSSEESTERTTAVYEELFAYFENVLMPLKREEPAEDLSTVLVQGLDAGELTLRETLYLHQMIMNAGFETTHTTIAQVMRMMLEEPKVEEDTFRALEEVGSGPVVDEFLRYLSPVIAFVRTSTCETEIAGQKIRKGDQLAMFFTAANRDPATFTDPHTFNPWRNEPGMLTFGAGPHRCIGAPVARMEVQILLEEMARRGIRLRLAGKPTRLPSNFINTLNGLPVEIIAGN